MARNVLGTRRETRSALTDATRLGRPRIGAVKALCDALPFPAWVFSLPRAAAFLLCVMLVAMGVLLLPIGAAQAQPVAPPSFSDVPVSNPAHDAIVYLAGAGVISGFNDGTFGPDQVLKRGQATKILVNWQGVSPASVTGTPSFIDVDAVYRPYVEAAVAKGWIGGYPDGTFRAYNQLTREQMAIILIHSMGLASDAEALGPSKIDQALAPFADWVAVSAAARPYMALAVTRGLFNGDGTRLSPKSGITRAQFCMVVLRAELGGLAVPQGVRFASDYTDKTRMVVDLSQAPGAATAAITPDGTLTVDYAGGGIGGTLTQAVASTEVKTVTAAMLKYRPQMVRLTFKLARYQTFRVMSLAPSEGHGYRIVVDVFRRIDGPPGDGPPLICVDPGHGGTDPGAIGADGSPEKDFNLAISLALAQNLRDAGLGVVMTRSDDSFPTLKQRTDLANTAQASLFVAVHNNAGDPGASGTETYYWHDPNDPTKYSVEGQKLAILIQQDLVAALGSVDRGAKTHPKDLWVLAQANMTAVLTEVGFVDNPVEEAKLKSPAYQKLAAGAISKGIFDYLGWSTTVYTTEQSGTGSP